MVTGLANGAAGFVPVEEISEALACATTIPGRAARRRTRWLADHGARKAAGWNSIWAIHRASTPASASPGGPSFRPRRMGPAPCGPAPQRKAVAVASFLNLTRHGGLAGADQPPEHIVLVCAGTAEFPALEDITVRRARCANCSSGCATGWIPRKWPIGFIAQAKANSTWQPIVARSNGRRLLANPELRDDVEFCLRRDIYRIGGACSARMAWSAESADPDNKKRRRNTRRR